MKKQYALILLALTVLYGYLTFLSPTDPDTLTKYNVSSTQLHLLSLTFIIPIAIIWAIAFYGFSKFMDYAVSISDRPDGKHLTTVAQGLQVLAVGLVMSSILTSALQNIARRNLEFVPTAVITQHYISLGIALLAYYLVYRGTRSLSGLVDAKSKALLTRWWFWLYAIVAGFYGYMALTDPNNSLVATTSRQGDFYLPNVILAVTLVAPYIVAWFLGIRGASYLAFYQQNTRGSIYKAALSKLRQGLVIIVGVSILLQFFTLFASRHSDQLANSSLGSLLVLIYFLVALIAAGYFVVAQGAKKLKKIEEVV